MIPIRRPTAKKQRKVARTERRKLPVDRNTRTPANDWPAINPASGRK
jgi:hypothetical protein